MTCSICNGKGYVEIDSGGVTPWNAEIVDYDFCVCNPRCECKNPVTYQMLSGGEVCYICGLRLPGASPDIYELVAKTRLTPVAADALCDCYISVPAGNYPDLCAHCGKKARR